MCSPFRYVSQIRTAQTTENVLGRNYLIVLRSKKRHDDVSTEDIPKEPQSGHFYVAICILNDNKIETLIEINQNDLSSF
jgi:hypothetical protein